MADGPGLHFLTRNTRVILNADAHLFAQARRRSRESRYVLGMRDAEYYHQRCMRLLQERDALIRLVRELDPEWEWGEFSDRLWREEARRLV